MSFWGIEVKPGKPHPYHSDNVQGRLCITQATLGLGSSKERTVLQCSVGHKSPVFLCSLLPNKMESCSLNLEFKDELVAFSVIGPRSVHLCGYFASDDGDNLRDEYEYESDSGEDIAETETSDDDSDEFDYGDDEFIKDDGDLGMFPPSPVPNSGVVIEEITDDGKAENGNGASEQMKKKKKTSDLEAQSISQRQIVAKSNAGASVFESEDEDGFPISSSHKSKATDQEPQAEAGGKKGKIDEEKKKKQWDDNNDAGKKRKMKNADQDSQLERKTKKKQKEKLEEANELSKDESQPEVEKKQDTPDENLHDQRGQDMDADSVPKETSSDKKKKKKKKKKKTTQDVEGKSEDQANSAVKDKAKSSMEVGEKQSELGSSNVRTFSNGLVIEELAMGKPDGKKANPGSQVSVQYIGKLKKNGKIFDSCVGRAPFKFRLGVGSVIKGWDVGIAGMRVGDKRRLTIPPSMGYGDKGAGGVIPPNAWLVFDVELVNVR